MQGCSGRGVPCERVRWSPYARQHCGDRSANPAVGVAAVEGCRVVRSSSRTIIRRPSRTCGAYAPKPRRLGLRSAPPSLPRARMAPASASRRTHRRRAVGADASAEYLRPSPATGGSLPLRGQGSRDPAALHVAPPGAKRQRAADRCRAADYVWPSITNGSFHRDAVEVCAWSSADSPRPAVGSHAMLL